METSSRRKSTIVDQPIINSPFEYPKGHWVFEEGLPRREQGRRKAGYYSRTRNEKSHKTVVAAQEFIELPEVNKIRDRLANWRKNGYPGVSRISLDLLRHWTSADRTHRLFFCQLEAVETIIWLVEGMPSEKHGINLPTDLATDPTSREKGYSSFQRYCCKMATGSGKTVVMAMVVAWSVLNKLYNRQDKRFSDAILIICPNLTIKERLSVLKPSNYNNYYEKFDLVPRELLPELSKARIIVTNWHLFLPINDESIRSVIRRGIESNRSFIQRWPPKRKLLL